MVSSADAQDTMVGSLYVPVSNLEVPVPTTPLPSTPVPVPITPLLPPSATTPLFPPVRTAPLSPQATAPSLLNVTLVTNPTFAVAVNEVSVVIAVGVRHEDTRCLQRHLNKNACNHMF
jgi:hypothetical protein